MDESRSEFSIEGEFAIAAGPSSLTPREREVYRAIVERNAMLGETYSRAVALTRGLGPTDRLAPILGLHLCRELMNALPKVIDMGGGLASVPYESKIAEVAALWPAGADGSRVGEMPEAARSILVDLLAKHETSTSRAGEYARMVRRLDPSSWKAPTVLADRQWRRIHGDAIGIAHHLMRVPDVDWPSIPRARDTVNELTDVLFVMLAPHYAATDALDELLARRTPTLDDAREVARLLGLYQQADHFFSRADPDWLNPLVEHGRFFDPGPSFIPADEPGSYRYPPWPQGKFLLRAVAASPEIVLAQLMPRGDVGKPRLSTNPYVVKTVVEILLAAPVELVARHLARAPGWPRREQVDTVTATDLMELALRLILAGEAARGYGIAGQVIRALAAEDRGGMSDFAMGKCLAILVDGVEARDEIDASQRLFKFLVDEIQRQPEHQLSTMWLPAFEDLDPDEHLLPHHPWRLVLAAYRVAQRLSGERLSDAVDRLLRSRREVLRRLGVALIAKRPTGLLPLANKIVAAPEKWDSGPTYEEFKDAVRATFGTLSPEPREALIKYAVAARAVRNRHRRATRQGFDGPAAEWVQVWRSRLLGRVSDHLTPSERRRLGRLSVGEEERPRRGFHRVEPAPSPLSAAELTANSAHEVAEYLRAWTPTGGFFDADRPTLAAELRSAISADPSVWEGRISDMGVVPLVYANQVLRAFEEIEHKRDDADGWAPLFSWMSSCLDEAPPDDELRVEAERTAASTIDRVARRRALTAAESSAATGLLMPLLRSGHTGADAFIGRRDTSADTLLRSMNSVRGEAIDAGAWLLHRLLEGESDTRDGAELEGALFAAAREQTAFTAVTFGRALPLLLEADEKHGDHRWRDSLLTDVEERFRVAVWEGYLLTWTRPIGAVIRASSGLYRTLVQLVPSLDADERELRSVVEQLGHHLAMLYLWAHVPDADVLLQRFFELARDQHRSTVARFIADHLAIEDQNEAAADRAISFLRSRPAHAGAMEGEALVWASRSRYRRDLVLTGIVLPAIEAGHGGTDFADVLGLMVEFAAEQPAAVGSALIGLMQRDRWHSMPTLAADELDALLRILVASGNTEANEAAVKVVNDLGARGYGTYRALLS